ncbi:MAG: NUDIX domain-containing protein [Bacteroidetes bacterium]|jgi:ADP-ribose pyrophosphatase YjhB (NUDIX family)|nr:NUDIX domain-containing protein [Bacteroidota bacterium]
MNWLELARRLQLIAQSGRTYSEGEHDQARYKELLEIVDDIYASHIDSYTPKIKEWLFDEKGYLTPKVDVRAVVVRKNAVLLVREKIDDCWALPGGWADTGLTPFENAVKETREEAGLEVEPVRLLAVLDKKMHPHPPEPFYTYKLFIHCRQKDDGAFEDNIETSDARFFMFDDLPALSEPRNTKGQIIKALEVLKKNSDTVCD